MAELSPELNYKLIDFCEDHFRTVSDRETILIPILQKWQGFSTINWEGNPKKFTTRLINMLPPDELKTTLNGLKLAVGEDGQTYIDTLCQEIENDVFLSANTPSPANRPFSKDEITETSMEPELDPDNWAELEFNRFKIHEILSKRFTEAELRRLCQNHREFRKGIYLSDSANQKVIADELIGYCGRMGLFHELLQWVKNERLKMYKYYYPFIYD